MAEDDRCGVAPTRGDVQIDDQGWRRWSAFEVVGSRRGGVTGVTAKQTVLGAR